MIFIKLFDFNFHHINVVGSLIWQFTVTSILVFNNAAFMFEGPIKEIKLTLITCCSTPSFLTFPITQTGTISIFAASLETMTREITVNTIESMGTFYNILYDFLFIVKAAPHECVFRTG